MELMESAFRDGGVWPYLVLATALLATLCVAGFSGLGLIKKKRLATVYWWIPVVVVAVLGLVAIGAEANLPAELVDEASGSRKQLIVDQAAGALVGLAVLTALANTVLGLLIAAGQIPFALFRGDGESRYALVPALAVAAGSLVGGLGLAAWIVLEEFETLCLLIPAALSVGGLTCAVVALKIPAAESATSDAGRWDAPTRYAAGLGTLWATAWATVAAMCSMFSANLEALTTSSPENRPEMFEAGLSFVIEAGYLGLGAIVVGGIILGILVTGASKRAPQPPARHHALLSALLVALVLGTTGYAYLGLESFAELFYEIIVEVNF